MANVEHNTLGNTANMHGVVFATVANAAALAAVTPTTAQVAQRHVWLQSDTNQLWIPKSTTIGDFVPLVPAATATPQALSTAAVGTATKFAREDHVHAMPRLDQVGAPTASVGLNSQEITSVGTPTAATSALRRSDVDAVIVAVTGCTTVALPAYTASGGPGTGFTLTANANGAFPTLDASAVITAAASGEPLSARFLLHNGASSTDNGVYVLTQQGSAGTPWIAVRYTGLDTAAKIAGSKVRVMAGAQSGGGEYAYLAKAAITMGTTRIFYKRIDERVGPNEGFRAFNDFATPSVQTLSNANAPLGDGMAGIAIGTGTSTQAASLNSSFNVRGVISSTSGTTTTGFAGIEGGWTAASTQPDGGDCFVPTQNTGFMLEVRAGLVAASTAAQEFSVQIGFAKQRNAGQKIAADFIGFVYDRTSAVSTTNWIVVCSSGGVTTSTIIDSGIACGTAGSMNRLRMEKDAGDTNIRFYIDGSLIATFNTNVPTAQLLALMCIGFKNAGTTSTNMHYTDWIDYEVDFPERRAA